MNAISPRREGKAMFSCIRSPIARSQRAVGMGSVPGATALGTDYIILGCGFTKVNQLRSAHA
jgi:hypothetical protein